MSAAVQAYESLISSILEDSKNLSSREELELQVRQALEWFKRSDIDGSGSLGKDEVKYLCSLMGLPMSDDEEEKIDADGSGSLSEDEWMTWWLHRASRLPNPAKQQEVIARNTFKQFDFDGSDTVSASEFDKLINQLGVSFTKAELEEAVSQLDSNNSGSIDIEEFLSWWLDRNSSGARNGAVARKLKQLASKAKLKFYTDIHTAVWKGDIELVKLFLDSPDAGSKFMESSDNSVYGCGFYPMHYAAYQGNIQMTELLLSKRAKVDPTNDHGFTPLFYAAQMGHLDVCRLLLANRADPKVTGKTNTLERPLCPVDHVSHCPALIAIFEEGHKDCFRPLAVPSRYMLIMNF